VKYLLDTNVCIALINGSPISVRTQFQRISQDGSEFFVSSITAFELWYGVAKSKRREFNKQRLETFFSGPIQLLSLENEDAEVGGPIRAELEAREKPIGAYDVLIAGQALSRNLTLVTANAAEFGRIKQLSWVNWAKA
jgi:tRNA(fMet)-specific endonuclease VapC